MSSPKSFGFAFVTALLLSASAAGQENENAVPLTLGLELEGVELDKISVLLKGRDVTVSTILRNSERHTKKIGWYASTPQFSILGAGEEHFDKSFSDVHSTVNGKVTKAMVYQRGYFMGRDITPELIQLGLGPLPNLNYDVKKLARLRPVNSMKFQNWQGYVNYAWSSMVRAESTTTVDISYRALPAFALTELDGDSFAYAVRQHCGDENAVRKQVKTTVGAISEVIIESYEIPIAYVRMREVEVKVVLPRTNWLRAHPIVSMVCGLKNGAQLANIGGTINEANGIISIMVISTPQNLSSPLEEKNGK